MTNKEFAEKFKKSQDMFYTWQHKKYALSCCMAQLISAGKTILIEKWKSETLKNPDIYMVEIYANGNGFQIYKAI